MAKIRAYTTIKQSRKLAKILPPESADMYYEPSTGYCTKPSEVRFGDIKYAHPRSIRCWSLAALLDILAKETHNIDEDGHVVLSSYKGNWWNVSPINCVSGEIRESNSPLDAVFEMVVCLKENGKI